MECHLVLNTFHTRFLPRVSSLLATLNQDVEGVNGLAGLRALHNEMMIGSDQVSHLKSRYFPGYV